LYYPSKGDILINGSSSREFSTESYFNQFSAVFQDYCFMPMTVAENITAEQEYDQERLYAAFEKAGITDKINSLPEKENTLMVKEVYKNAADFSGGEKQKLLLAKAIYKKAPVLILDEPTAARLRLISKTQATISSFRSAIPVLVFLPSIRAVSLNASTVWIRAIPKKPAERVLDFPS
jgi:ABC-type multidrug transport system fused ATPase/permease subunit